MVITLLVLSFHYHCYYCYHYYYLLTTIALSMLQTISIAIIITLHTRYQQKRHVTFIPFTHKKTADANNYLVGKIHIKKVEQNSLGILLRLKPYTNFDSKIIITRSVQLK